MKPKSKKLWIRSFIKKSISLTETKNVKSCKANVEKVEDRTAIEIVKWCAIMKWQTSRVEAEKCESTNKLSGTFLIFCTIFCLGLFLPEIINTT